MVVWSRKRGRSVGLEKRNVLRLDLKQPREGFFLRGRERSFHVEGLKTEKVQVYNSLDPCSSTVHCADMH